MIHYHGTPITPSSALYELAGSCFCVSYARPDDVSRCHQIGQSVMLDNGAFSLWKSGTSTDWPGYYAWAEKWLQYPTTWAVIPDVIDGGVAVQDALIGQWPHGPRGAPVWHMDEPITRLLALCDNWELVCIGSTALYATVLSDAWQARMDAAFNAVAARHRFMSKIHMLRGMACSGRRWPFYSVDSTDIARNHHLPHKSPAKMTKRWDSMQCPGSWRQVSEQMEMV